MNRTPHRKAASNPEVAKLIKNLTRTWKHTSAGERRAMVAELLANHCSIRGIAHEANLPESTVRQYSKPPDQPVGISLPRPFPAPVTPASTAGKPLAAKAGPSKKKYERLESIDSLRARVDEIIVNLIRTELGAKEQSPDLEKLAQVLSYARKYALGPFAKWAWTELLAPAVTESAFAHITRPSGTPTMSKIERLGLWVATILNSLGVQRAGRSVAIDEVERQLVQEPKSERKGEATPHLRLS